MKLLRLRIERLAGIDRPFELENLGSGLNIIIGPNGIGKSRVCSVVRGLLWHEHGISSQGFAARADFEHQDSRWQVVRDGSLHRWQRDGIDAIPPTLPGDHLDGCFFVGLRDLLDDSDRAGRYLAGEIRKQMSGGFDLDKVEQRFAGVVTKNIGRKENKVLGAADQEIRRAERVQIDLERSERALASLETQAAEAERASQRLAAFTTAISLQRLRSDHTQRKSELDTLPEALASLDGKEDSLLDKLLERLVQKRAERDAVDDTLDASRAAARASRLEAPLDLAALVTWRERAEKLITLEGRLEAARVAMAAASEDARQCRRTLGAYAAPESEFDPERPLGIADDFDLFGFLRESHQLASEREAATERLRLLAARTFSDEDSRRLELLRRGVVPLRSWLRAPDPDLLEAAEGVGSSWRRWVGAGAVFGAVGMALQTTRAFESWAPTWWIVVGVGIGLALAGLSVWLGSKMHAGGVDSTDWRSVAAKQFPEALESPSRWSIGSVTESLRQLEDELARKDANEKRARDRGVERGQLEETLNGLSDRLDELEARRGVLFSRLGLAAMQPDVELVDLARALDASRNAELAAGGARAELKELEGLHAGLLGGIAVTLEELGEHAPTDGPSARAGVYSVTERDRALRVATDEGVREGVRRDRLEREIEDLEADKAEIFRTAGIESVDRAELTRRLNLLGRFRELNVEISRLGVDIERAESDLDQAGESSLARRSLTQIQEEQALQEKKSSHSKDLNSQIVETRVHAANARKGHLIEDAIAKKTAARSALHDRRDEALEALAGHYLVDSVRREHETNQMPRVLERARSRFANFTHHRYQLEVSPNEGGAFVAVDTKSGEGLSPSKLSDGTRAQLILAARLAFAEEAEQGADLPLFLDEAMDHSDPERFHAIAISLAHMVGEEGRQIFYLTNDPTDLERFSLALAEVGGDEPTVLNLAEIRGQAARIDEPEVLRVAPLQVVQPPAGRDPESYGVAIGVSPLDPSRDSLSQHLFYLLRDDLPLLHSFLEARIESVGQCRNIMQGGSALARSVTTGGEVGSGLEARIELLENFCLAWREGRGMPVGRSALEESGSVTEKYLDAFAEVASEFEGDARRLIDTVHERKDPRMSGFRTKSAAALEQFLIDQGHLDDRPILDEKETIERAQGTPASNQLTSKVTAELVHQWWRLSQQAEADAD